MSEREAGFYWVKKSDKWTVGKYCVMARESWWEIIGSDLKFYPIEFDEIGTKIGRPATEAEISERMKRMRKPRAFRDEHQRRCGLFAVTGTVFEDGPTNRTRWACTCGESITFPAERL